MATFALAGAAATMLGIADLPVKWRLLLGVAGLIPLAALDLRAMLRSTYCPIGWRRQTPRAFMRRHHALTVAVLWGFDTGLVVTTFRVAAISWGALYLALLGFSGSWSGLAYGLGFAAPFAIVLLRSRLGHAASAPNPSDPGLESMLRMRSTMQGVSAALLVASGAVLLYL